MAPVRPCFPQLYAWTLEKANPWPGIGASIAHALIRAGCTKLILTDVNYTTLQSTSLSLKALVDDAPNSASVLTVPGDISDPAFVDRLFGQIRSIFGRLDYAVNCAGIIGDNKPSTESNLEAFDRVNGVNYRGLWICSRKELEMMKGQQVRERDGYGGVRRQRGAIVNIASQLGIVGRPNAREWCRDPDSSDIPLSAINLRAYHNAHFVHSDLLRHEIRGHRPDPM